MSAYLLLLYCDQVDLPILLPVSSAVVLVISETLQGHANQSRFQCQPQGCVPPHYAEQCVAFFIHMGTIMNGLYCITQKRTPT